MFWADIKATEYIYCGGVKERSLELRLYNMHMKYAIYIDDHNIHAHGSRQFYIHLTFGIKAARATQPSLTTLKKTLSVFFGITANVRLDESSSAVAVWFMTSFIVPISFLAIIFVVSKVQSWYRKLKKPTYA